MKNILIFLLLLTALTLSAQNYSPCYKEKYQQGVTLYNKGDYSGAKAKFVASKSCPVPNTQEADTWIGKCNTRIKDEETAKQEVEAYNRCTSVSTCNEYLNKYPNGKYVTEVKKRKKELQAEEEAKQKAKIESEEAKWAEAKAVEDWRRKQESGRAELSVNGIAFTMVFVKGNTFMMGCTSEQDGDCLENEKPSHTVTLDDFWIGETEVTQALWKEVMGTTVAQQRDKRDPGLLLRGEGLSYPMYYVSYNDAMEFCNMLNILLADQLPSGWRFSLPTEAQWEYAARGGIHKSTYKYAGGNDLENVAWYSDNSDSRTHPVKGKSANALGLYDMCGNVYEWCLDWYSDNYYNVSTSNNPTGPSPSSDSNRVLRGGSWLMLSELCRISSRLKQPPANCHGNIGFRLVLTPLYLKTTSVTNIETTSAVVSGEILFNISDPIMDAGFVWSFRNNCPTIRHTRIDCVVTNGQWSGKICNLKPNTEYYVRTYVKTANDKYYYGNVVKFKTNP